MGVRRVESYSLKIYPDETCMSVERCPASGMLLRGPVPLDRTMLCPLCMGRVQVEGKVFHARGVWRLSSHLRLAEESGSEPGQMTAQEIQSEAEKIVDKAARAEIDLYLFEYKRVMRYREDYPDGLPLADHNAVIRAVVREAGARGIYCVLRLVD